MTRIDFAHRRPARARRTRSLAALTAAALAVAALVAGPDAAPAQAASTSTHVETFTSPSGQRWTVPAGVTRIRLEVAGAHGATTYPNYPASMPGGRGGLVTFEMPVVAGAQFTFYGSTPGSGTNGGKGWRTGGKGGDKSGNSTKGGGGGGASAVVLGDQVLAVAGGGGGAGGWARTIQNKADDTIPYIIIRGGAGGDAGMDGKEGMKYELYSVKPGKGGAGAALVGKNGANGTPSAWFSDGAGGGGGGGGWASGAAGGSGKSATDHNAGGGGGGGSNWVDARFARTMGISEGADGYVRVSYEDSISLVLDVPTTFAEGQELVGRAGAYETIALEPRFGRHVITVDEQELADFVGWMGWFTFTLPAGVHAIEHAYFEAGREVARNRSTVTVTPAGGGLGAPDPVRLAVDATDFLFQSGAPISMRGSLTSPAGGVPGNVPVSASLDGVPSGSVTTSASGDFSFTLPAGTPAGNHVIELTSAATALFLASAPLRLPITVVEERTEVSITSVAPTTPVYGEPVDVVAQVGAADGAGPSPTGVVVLADDDDLIGIAPIGADGTATFSGVFPHATTTSLRALYAGDTVYEAATSPARAFAVADAATATVLDVSSLTGRAGDLTAIQATVSAQAGSVLEPVGVVELLLDGEVFATAAIGADADATPGDGTVSYSFDTEHLPAGPIELQARFVPEAGYAASASARTDLDLEEYQARLFVSPSDLEIREGATAAIAARIEVLAPAAGPLVRQRSGAPAADGTLVAYRGSSVVGTAEVDPATGDAELRIGGLPAGAGSLRIVFLPEALGVTPAESTVAYTVAAVPAPAPVPSPAVPSAGPDPAAPAASGGASAAAVAAGGGEVVAPLLIGGGALLALILGGVLVGVRRRGALG